MFFKKEQSEAHDRMGFNHKLRQNSAFFKIRQRTTLNSGNGDRDGVRKNPDKSFSIKQRLQNNFKIGGGA
jgi:hypothetical protein